MKNLTCQSFVLVLCLTGFFSFLMSPLYLLALPKSDPSSATGNHTVEPPPMENKTSSPFPPLTNTNNPTSPFSTAAVAADNPQCSQIGVDIMIAGGNAIDAAISTGLCQGIVNAFASGIGGGAAIMVRTSTGEVWHLDAREKAPMASNETMFVNNPGAATRGSLSIAVPGEMLGYYALWERFGSKRLTWAALLQPAITLTSQGYLVNQIIESRIQSAESHDPNHTLFPEFWEIYANPNGERKRQGDTITNPHLSQTFQILAEQGGRAFYEGTLADAIEEDLREIGGILTAQDLRNYTAEWRQPVSSYFHGLKVYGTSPPISGGICTALALNILEEYNLPLLYQQGNFSQAIHWLIEAFKFTYSDRLALGDPEYVPDVMQYVQTMKDKDHAALLRQRLSPNQTFPTDHYQDLFPLVAPPEDHGTSHWSVIDGEGNAVGITSTVNLNYGSMVVGRNTGILFNDQMDDFSTPGLVNSFGFPPTPNNYIAPGKRPLSSMTPTIVTKNGRPFIIAGGSGGSRIISGTIQVILNILAFERTANEAVSLPRLHHQLLPPVLGIEVDFDSVTLNRLQSEGHILYPISPTSNVNQVIVVQPDGIWAASDWRKGGAPAGF